MTILSQATTRLFQRNSGPTNNESGAEVGTFFFNTATSQYYICADATPSAQIWNYVAFPVPVPVPDGGTGATTLTGVLTGNGTSPVTANPITQYNVLLGGASNAVTNVSGTGSAGQVLTSAGAGAPPTWTSASGSGTYVLLQTATPSSGTLVFNFSGYNRYKIFIQGMYPVNTASSGNIQLSTNGGTNWITTGYVNQSCRFISNSGTFNSYVGSSDINGIYFVYNTINNATQNISPIAEITITQIGPVVWWLGQSWFYYDNGNGTATPNSCILGGSLQLSPTLPINAAFINIASGWQNLGSASIYGLAM